MRAVIRRASTANLGLSIWLVHDYGQLGVALGTTIPRVLSCIFVLPWVVCRLMRLKVGTFVLQAVLGPAVGSPPCFALGWGLSFWELRNWPVLFCKGALIGLAYTLVLWMAGVTSVERGLLRKSVLVKGRSMLGWAGPED